MRRGTRCAWVQDNGFDSCRLDPEGLDSIMSGIGANAAIAAYAYTTQGINILSASCSMIPLRVMPRMVQIFWLLTG